MNILLTAALALMFGSAWFAYDAVMSETKSAKAIGTALAIFAGLSSVLMIAGSVMVNLNQAITNLK